MKISQFYVQNMTEIKTYSKVYKDEISKLILHIQKEEFEKWLSENATNVQQAQAHGKQEGENFGVVEFVVTLNDGKSYMKRITIEPSVDFETTAKTYIDSVATKYNLTLSQ